MVLTRVVKTAPYLCTIKNNRTMAEMIFTVGAVLAKGLAVCLMLASCAAIYLVESRRVN